MTLTHARLLDAVRAAGRDRESFTCADVRQQLGLSTGDRKLMNRFYKLFGALHKDEANQIEKLGSNCYRLRAVAAAPVLETELETLAPDFQQACEVEANSPASEAVTPAHASFRPASKARFQWLTRLVGFFSRRPGNRDVAPGVPVGA